MRRGRGRERGIGRGNVKQRVRKRREHQLKHGFEQHCCKQRCFGSGGSGGGICAPNATTDCYDGPAGTMGVALCKGGQHTCNQAGTAFGACAGEVVPQPETCASGLDQNCDGFKCVLWAELFDNGGVLSGLAFDSKGNTFIVGHFLGTLTFGNVATLISFGGGDIFIAKLDPSGNPVWAKQFGDQNFQGADSVGVDSGGNVILGGHSASAISFGGPMVPAGLVVAKFTNDGALLWSKGLVGGGSSTLSSIATTPSGDVVVGGNFDAAIDFGDGPIAQLGNSDAFVAKLRASDGSGKVSDGFWGNTFGGANAHDYTIGVVVDVVGNVLFAGNFTKTIQLGANSPMSALGSGDGFLGKLTAAGGQSWQVHLAALTAASNAQVSGLTVDAAGGLIVAGECYGSVNLGGGLFDAVNGSGFIAHFDSTGAHLWEMEFGTSSASAEAIAIDAAGNFLVSGSFQGTLNLGGNTLTASASGDSFLAKFKSGAVAATFEWNQQFAGISSNLPVAEMPTGESAMGGTISQTTDFGTGALSPPANGASLFVAKFNP